LNKNLEKKSKII